MPLTGLPYPLACNTYTDQLGQAVKCVDTSDTVDAQCPTGVASDPQNAGWCADKSSKTCPQQYSTWRGLPGKCVKLNTPTCPAGSTAYIVSARGERQRYPVCIPNSVQLVEKPIPSNGSQWPCDAGVDFLTFDTATQKIKCIPPATGSGATPTPSSGTATSTPTSTPAPVTPDVKTTLEQINQSLKPFRPPTSPGSDKAIERNAILSGNKSLVFVQLVLFILLAVLIVYLVLPPNYANGVAFLLLCVGVGYGFFLRR